MKFNRKFLKRRYFEARAGNTVISPLISASTFIGVAYLYIKEFMPFYFFVPIFLIGMITVVTIIGLKFRNIQLSTDVNMQYEKMSENAKTQCLIMEAQMNMMDKDGIDYPDGYMERYRYMKGIAEQ